MRICIGIRSEQTILIHKSLFNVNLFILHILTDLLKLKCQLYFQQPSGLLAFLESTESPPAEALEADRIEQRDNLLLAQASAPKPRAPHWDALDRQLKNVERHIEVSESASHLIGLFFPCLVLNPVVSFMCYFLF